MEQVKLDDTSQRPVASQVHHILISVKFLKVHWLYTNTNECVWQGQASSTAFLLLLATQSSSVRGYCQSKALRHAVEHVPSVKRGKQLHTHDNYQLFLQPCYN